MNKESYTQCHLERTVEDGTRQSTVWIPTEFAKVGKPIKVKIDEVWQNGWVVKATYSTTDRIPDSHKAIKAHRDRTGDSNKKVVTE